MTTESLTHPLPFFHHVAGVRVLYIASGPCPLVFSISIKDIVRRAPVVNPEPVVHPFGKTTVVASLAAAEVRRELSDAVPLADSPLDATLALWANFCDDVADRLHDGEPLTAALDDTWIVDDGEDVDLDAPPSG